MADERERDKWSKTIAMESNEWYCKVRVESESPSPIEFLLFNEKVAAQW